MRRPVKGNLVAKATKPNLQAQDRRKRASKRRHKHVYIFVDENGPVMVKEYAEFVAITLHGVQHMGLLYSVRADCENGFDKLKNQWDRVNVVPRTRQPFSWIPACLR
jgi:hypothetical protein